MPPTSMTAAVSTDPLLTPNPQRFVLFPIQYPKVWEMFKKHEVRRPRPSPSLRGSSREKCVCPH